MLLDFSAPLHSARNDGWAFYLCPSSRPQRRDLCNKRAKLNSIIGDLLYLQEIASSYLLAMTKIWSSGLFHLMQCSFVNWHWPK
jgi:hypothetical protein